MTIISNKMFGGLIPRIPADKLPDDKAQTAVNCNFAYGELRPLKAPFLLTTLANAAKSVFSTDGLLFYSWPWRTKAWKGPVINDSYNRMYFIGNGGGLRVAQTTGMRTDGGEPAVSYKVGVPSVAAAPTVTYADRTSLPDYPNATFKIYSSYVDSGKVYDEAQVAFVTAAAFKEFRFTASSPVATSAQTSGGAVPNSLRTLKIVELVYIELVSRRESDEDVYRTIGFSPAQQAAIGDAGTVIVNGTTYTRVQTVTPEAGSAASPGTILASGAEQYGSVTPSSASLSVRVDLVDTVKNTTIFSLSALGGGTSGVSNAVPGGVQLSLVKDGAEAGAWKAVLRWGIMDTRAYVVTIVNDWSEESKPSPPVLAEPTYIQTVLLTFTPPSTSGYVPATQFRLYRSTDSGDYISTTSSPVAFTGATVAYNDTATAIANTDAVLSSVGWDTPPAALKGLTLLPNGFFAGFVGDTLYFSEPYRPWAWPHSMTFPYAVVGMRAIESSLVVTTNTYPYMVSGVHPSAMSQAQLTMSQAGISDHGMTVVGSTVSYISNDGLVGVKGYDVDFTSGQAFWTRELWKQIFGGYLQDLELAYHDGSLVCGSPTAGKMWEIRLDSEGGGNLTMRDNTTYADALYVLPTSDQLYEVRGNKLYQHNGSAASQAYEWMGKDHILPKPTSLTAGYINCTGSVTVSVYADGVLRHTQTFTAATYFRMPTGQKALRWAIKLAGTGVVKEISLAERRQELMRV